MHLRACPQLAFAALFAALPFARADDVPESEPNDLAAAAAFLAPGQVGVGSIGAIGDVDHWQISGATAGQLVFILVEAGASEQGQDCALRVLGADGVFPLGSEDDSGPGLAAAYAAVPESGILVLRVTESRGEALITEYRVHHAVVAPVDVKGELEPNDAPWVATAVQSPAISGSFQTEGDVDYYAFSAQVGDTIVAIVDEDPDEDSRACDAHVEIVDGTAAAIAEGDSAADLRTSAVGPLVAAAAGLFFLRIRDGGNGEDAEYCTTVLRNGLPINAAPTTFVDDTTPLVTHASFMVSWSSHAKGKHKDTFNVKGHLNLAGLGASLEGASVDLRLGGVALTSAPLLLNSKGKAKLVTPEGMALSFSLKRKGGKFAATVEKADLRPFLAVVDAPASDAKLPLNIEIELGAPGLLTPVATAIPVVQYDTNQGKHTAGAFGWKEQTLVTGAVRVVQLKASEGPSGHRLDLKATLLAPLSVPLLPEGDLSLTVGSAFLVIPLAALEASAAPPEQRTYTLKKGSVASIESLTLNNKKRELLVRTSEVAGTGIPLAGGPSAATSHVLAIRLEFDDANAKRNFSTNTDLQRKKAASKTWAAH